MYGGYIDPAIYRAEPYYFLDLLQRNPSPIARIAPCPQVASQRRAAEQP